MGFLNLIMRGYGPSLERWTKDGDIFRFDLVLVPIHLEMHWCIAVIDFRSSGVFYYDPLGGHNMPALSALLNYLKLEHLNKKGTDLDIRHFAKEIVTDCPKPLTFCQEDMPYYRKRMIWEIHHDTLMCP